MPLLNQQFGFDEVRWATMRKSSYDSREAFQNQPLKKQLAKGTRLYRLMGVVAGSYYGSPWWMPEETFTELQLDAARATHGGGALFRNYVKQYLALPGEGQLSVVEIELTGPVYAWLGQSAPLFDRPGGMPQVFLPNLAGPRTPTRSAHARVRRTYWLKF